MDPMRWWIAIAVAACNSTEPAADRPPQNIVFATSAVQTGNLGGVTGGDAICNDLAHEARLGGTWVAWLSDSTTTAFSRVENVSGGWVLVDGTPIALSANDLVTQSILAPIARDERGRDIRSAQPEVWTGTMQDGTQSDADCAHWTIEDATTSGTIGSAALGSYAFGSLSYRYCNQPRRLYCFETDRSAAVTVVPVTGRIAFISAGTWAPNAGGVANADALCASEAAAAHLTGTYLALLPLATAESSSRFDTSGAPWVNTVGVAIADPASDLFSAAYLGLMNRRADGTVSGNDDAWSGDPIDSATENGCMAWTSAATGQLEVFCGSAWATDRVSRYAGNNCFCEAPNLHLYCLQP